MRGPDGACRRPSGGAGPLVQPFVPLKPKPLPAAVLARAPTQPVDIKLSASRHDCALNPQAREILLGVHTLPHGSYQLTAVVGSAEVDLCIYSYPRSGAFALQKACLAP